MYAFFYSFIIITLILYTYIVLKGTFKKTTLTDDEILQLMEKGYVEGGIEDSADIKNKEIDAINDVFNKIDVKNKSGSVKNKFYEGDINWKFTDTGASNSDCWQNWDYAKKGAKGEDIIIKENIFKTMKRDDGRVWCPVNEFTNSTSRKERDRPPTIMDKIDNNIDKVWGLIGATSIGIAEEFILRSMKKRALKTAQMYATKSSKELSESTFKRIGNQIKKEFNEKFIQKITKKTGNETGENIFKKTQSKLITEFKKEISDRVSSVLKKELSDKTFASFKKEVIEKYGKKTINSLKDDFVKKAFKSVKTNLDNFTINRLSALVKNTASMAIKDASKKISYMALSASLKAKIINSALGQAQDFLYSIVYKNILKAFKTISVNISKLGAKLLWQVASVKMKAILALKAFFRSQANSFLSIGKNLIKNIDDVAMMTKSLINLSKTLSKAVIKNGFKKAASSIAKMMIKMKPGPLALFDMVSFALDMANVGGFDAYISTDDFIKEMEKSNTEMRNVYIDAIRNSPMYKEMNIKADDIEYPRMLDPTIDSSLEDLQDLISEKFNTIFRLANIGEKHLIVKTFFEELELDLASGKLTPDQLEDETVLNVYMDKIDIGSITDLVNNDLCNRAGGLIIDKNKCTYTKSQCDNLYKWPLDDKETPEREGEMYAEFRDGKCVAANHAIRNLCDNAKAKWDTNTNSCKLDRDWCFSMGAEYDFNTKKCNIPLSQKVVEFIFGTSVTRLMKLAINPGVRPAQELINTFLNPPTTVEYVGTIKNDSLNKCVTLNTSKFPHKTELKPCDGSNEQQFYFNPKTELIVAESNKYRGRYLCLERPYGNGSSVYAHYCDNSVSKDQKWNVDTDRNTITHKLSNTPVIARGNDISMADNGTSNEKKLTMGSVRNADTTAFNKKVAANFMNIATFGGVDWSPVVETGSVLFNVINTAPNVINSMANIFTNKCDILDVDYDIKELTTATSSSQSKQSTNYCGPIKIRDKCIDVENRKLSDGTNPVIWDCNAGDNQIFAYNRTDKSIRPNLNKNFCLDIGSGNPGDLVKWWGCNGTQPQKFNYNSDTKQISLDGNSGKCLDLLGDNNTNGTKFQVLECKNHRAQQFNIKSCDDEEYLKSIGNTAVAVVGKTFVDLINPLNW
jgi:hypothetical protein